MYHPLENVVNNDMLQVFHMSIICAITCGQWTVFSSPVMI